MVDLFLGPKGRLEYTKAKIRDLELAILAYKNSEPFQAVVEIDNENNQLHKLKLAKPFPSNLSYLAYEITEGLRAVLDQIAYSIALTTKPETPISAWFPISDSEEAWENAVNGRCKNIPDDFKDLFRHFKPFKGGSPLLWSLNELCKASKHRFITPIAIVGESIHVNKIRVMGAGYEFGMGQWNREKQELIFAKTSPSAQASYDVECNVVVTFDQVGVMVGEPVLPFINEVAIQCEIIIGSVENLSKQLEIEITV